MTNYLRIALKRLFSEQAAGPEVVFGNYRVKQKAFPDSGLVAINHLKFNGEEEYHSCKWSPHEKAMYICEGESCPPGEIVFVLRTIQKLGYEIEHIVYEAAGDARGGDVSQRFAKYLGG